MMPQSAALTVIHLLFSPFYAATFSMDAGGGLLIASSRERALAWGVVFCVMAAIALTLYLSRSARRWAPAVLLAALLIPLLIMPSVRRESIYVQPHGITVQSGPWIMPSRTFIDLSNLEQIRQDGAELWIGGRLVESNAIWHLSRRDGSRQKLLLGSFFTAHRMAVAQYLRDRGHSVGRP